MALPHPGLDDGGVVAVAQRVDVDAPDHVAVTWIEDGVREPFPPGFGVASSCSEPGAPRRSTTMAFIRCLSCAGGARGRRDARHIDF